MAIDIKANHVFSDNGLDIDSMLAILANRIDYNRYEKPLFSRMLFNPLTLNAGEYTDQVYHQLTVGDFTKYGNHPQNVIDVNEDGYIKLFDNFQYLMFFFYNLESNVTSANIAASGSPYFETYNRVERLTNGAWIEFVPFGRERSVFSTFVSAARYDNFRAFSYSAGMVNTTDPVTLSVYFNKANYITQKITRARAYILAFPLEME